jgi:RNA polymerase sigma-70 factor (ECF subfamily)
MTRPQAAAPAPPGSDAALWRAAQDGDRDAFTALYHRHADAVWNHARRLTASRSAAEDVLAATFLAAWRRRGEVAFDAVTARPWLLAVAANEVRTHWRRNQRQQRVAWRVGPPPDVHDHADGVVASLDGRRRVHAVLAAIQDLPAGQRDAVALCLVGEVSPAEAAVALGVSEATVRSRIHRARLRLRAALGEEPT